MRVVLKPGARGLPEKPNPGSDNATTWNASAAAAPCRAGSVSGPITLANSTNDPGQPWISTQRAGVRMTRSLVDEVHGDAVDRRRELRKLVEPPLLRAPVEAGPPVRHQRLEVGQIGAGLPAGALDLVGKARVGQPRPQITQRGLGDVDPERHDGLTGRLGPRRTRPSQAQRRDGGESHEQSQSGHRHDRGPYQTDDSL